MATDISNTASILSYTYMSGTVEKTGGPKSDTVINDYEEPRVGLAKRCTVDSAPTATGVDLGEIITLDYRIANASTVDISYKTVTIQDSILTNPAIEIIPNSESGGTHVGDTVTKVFDPGLVPGDVAAYSIKIKVI